jgi:light-regulated signal transduction histidine kinase (bacteriophytochrome)
LIVAGVFLCFTLLAVYISRHQCEQARGTEREKAQLLEVLESSNRDLQDFAYIASHDLQAPLRKIIAFGGLLEDSAKGKLDGEDLEDIENMMGSARHMQRLINDLLTYSRIATQGKPLEPVALDEVVGGVVSLSMGQLLSECGGRVEVAGPLPWVMADPMQIHQLLQNLIENGFKYRKEGEAPVVTVRAVMRDGGKVCVEVQDNGMGIDAKYHESIFKMFHRLHSNDKIPGTGIGLAVCERIVKRFGGSIGVKSEPGAGSVFWFTMDCAPARGLEKAS